MRIERRIFINVKSHWSYVCVMCELLEMRGWKITFRPDINSVDILKYSYNGHDVVDDMEDALKLLNHGETRGEIQAIYDLNDPKRTVRYIE